MMSRMFDPEGIEAHVRDAFARTPLLRDPFPYVVVDDWLPPDFFDALVGSIPPIEHFAIAPERPERGFLSVPSTVGTTEQQAMWEFLVRRLIGGTLQQLLVDTFGASIRAQLAAHCRRVPDGDDFQLKNSNSEIIYGRVHGERSYSIAPHRDPKWKFVTALAYLPRPQDQGRWGTKLYRVRGDQDAPNGKPLWFPVDQCELVDEVAFVPNRLFAFLNFIGAHSADIPKDAPLGAERFVLQFKLGPTTRTMAALRAEMPDAVRERWPEKKTKEEKLAAAASEAYR
jgi:hypothetical protein